MHRNDCKRFYKICKKELPEGYEAISPYDGDDPFFRYGFRKKGTIRRLFKLEDFAPGSKPELDIDIFTFDNIEIVGGMTQKFQDKINNIIVDAIRMRCGFNDTNPQNPYRRLSRVLSILPKKVLSGIQETALSIHNNRETEYMCWFWHAYNRLTGQSQKASILKDRVKLRFEDFEFWAPAQYDIVLRRMFGDYMQLPPEWARTGHHPLAELVL
jgi:lipopolysaccharide cholinephosphotransferase